MHAQFIVEPTIDCSVTRHDRRPLRAGGPTKCQCDRATRRPWFLLRARSKPNRFLTAVAKKPRTECRCQPVAIARGAIDTPRSWRSMAIICACLVCLAPNRLCRDCWDTDARRLICRFEHEDGSGFGANFLSRLLLCMSRSPPSLTRPKRRIGVDASIRSETESTAPSRDRATLRRRWKSSKKHAIL